MTTDLATLPGPVKVREPSPRRACNVNGRQLPHIPPFRLGWLPETRRPVPNRKSGLSCPSWTGFGRAGWRECQGKERNNGWKRQVVQGLGRSGDEWDPGVACGNDNASWSGKRVLGIG